MARKGASKRPSRRRARGGGDRVDRLVAVQQRSIKRFANFLADVATLAMQGEYRPADWTKRYAQMVKDLGEDLGEFTRALFKG